ncbi:hypothetical protein Tco_1425545, partial [Tanacetum coccineum]
DLDNSTSNVLIPLDSWTSGLLVYKLPLSDDKEKGPLKDDKGKGLLKDDKGSLTGLKIVDDLEKMIWNVEININKAKEKMLKEIGDFIQTPLSELNKMT